MNHVWGASLTFCIQTHLWIRLRGFEKIKTCLTWNCHSQKKNLDPKSIGHNFKANPLELELMILK